MSSTENLLQEHLIVRRLGFIAKRCSDVLYMNKYIPIEDIQIISVVIEEFVDGFHHGKEEKAYFPVTKYKNSFSEDIRKFLIEHEFARRIAKMLRRELDSLIDHDLYNKTRELKWIDKSKEPVARFLKSYSLFVFDHTGKEDVFFKKILEKQALSEEEDIQLVKHYELCKNKTGGRTRIEEMIRLVRYLEDREWMK